MQLGMIGLGRMGASMVHRLLKSGHQCVVYARRPAAVADMQKDGATGTASLQKLVLQLAPNTKMRAMVVTPDPAEPAEASKPAACEPNGGHHRPVRLSWARLLKRSSNSTSSTARTAAAS